MKTEAEAKAYLRKVLLMIRGHIASGVTPPEHLSYEGCVLAWVLDMYRDPPDLDKNEELAKQVEALERAQLTSAQPNEGGR